MMTTGRLRFIYLASIALALLAIVAGAAWDIFTPTPRFPEPTGPFGIGTRTYSWTDSSRPEPFTANRTDRRQIVVQVWYPASGGGTPQPYLASHFAAAAIAARFHLPVAVFRSLEHAPTHSRTDAPARAGRFPVLLNPTGFLSFRNASLFWIEELVSHGYVVVGFDQPGTAAATVLPDGRVIPAIADLKAFDRLMPLAMSRSLSRKLALNGVPLPDGIIPFLADDLRFVLDRLTAINTTDPVLAGHLDLSRAGVFGMSLGGYIGPETCRKDARLRACLAVDAGQTAPVAQDGLTQPLMIMTRDADVMRQERASAGGWPEDEIRHTIDTQRALYAHNRADAFYLTMNRMYHVNWTDAPVWSPLVRMLGLTGPVDPHVGFAETNAYSIAFFDRYLKGRPSPLLNPAVLESSDVTVEARFFDPHATQLSR